MTDQTTPPSQQDIQAQAGQPPLSAEHALARLSVLETLAVDNAIVLVGMVADMEGLTIPAIEKHLTHLRNVTIEGVARLGSEALTNESKLYADAVFKLIFEKVKESREARERFSREDAQTPTDGQIQ